MSTRRSRSVFLAVSLALLGPGLAACGGQQAPPQPQPAPASGATPGAAAEPPAPAAPPPPEVVKDVTLAEVGLEEASMDRSVDPCDDFYQFACGGWIASTKIPADKARWGRFSEINERNEQTLKAILDEARASKDADPVRARLGRFYGACMDEAAVEKAGLSAIDPMLRSIRQVRRAADVPAAITQLHRYGIWVVFDFDPDADFKNPSTNLLFIDSDGLGLPDRDYYLEKKFAEQRAFYRKHVQRMFALTGMRPGRARRAAADVMALETELAKVTKTRVQRRDVPGLYHPYDLGKLAAVTPHFDWGRYFEALGNPAVPKVSLTTPKYFERFDALLRAESPRVWRNYLTWQLLHTTARTLPKRFDDEAFSMIAELTGRKQQSPRWKRCIGATDGAMGEALGKYFVARRFPGDSKQAAERLIGAIRVAMGEALRANHWMSAKTREAAEQKLAKMSPLIGYPDSWRKYDFAVTAGNYAANALAGAAFETHRQLAKAGRPVDRSEWHMNPQTVNAYYSAQTNQMVFPAGILQPPFFAVNRAAAVNLGGIGMIAGHELTHGFDDQGAQFDGTGRMRNWWTPQDKKSFEARGRCLARQYSQYQPLPGDPSVKVNGDLTLGENIADLGGVKLAFRAYKQMRSGSGTHLRAGGYDEDQQFFLAVAQAWCSKTRPAEARRRVVTDPHSPPHFRVDGVVSNMPQFARAFQCKAKTPMHPVETCEVW